MEGFALVKVRQRWSARAVWSKRWVKLTVAAGTLTCCKDAFSRGKARVVRAAAISRVVSSERMQLRRGQRCFPLQIYVKGRSSPKFQMGASTLDEAHRWKQAIEGLVDACGPFSPRGEAEPGAAGGDCFSDDDPADGGPLTAAEIDADEDDVVVYGGRVRLWAFSRFMKRGMQGGGFVGSIHSRRGFLSRRRLDAGRSCVPPIRKGLQHLYYPSTFIVQPIGPDAAARRGTQVKYGDHCLLMDDEGSAWCALGDVAGGVGLRVAAVDDSGNRAPKTDRPLVITFTSEERTAGVDVVSYGDSGVAVSFELSLQNQDKAPDVAAPPLPVLPVLTHARPRGKRVFGGYLSAGGSGKRVRFEIHRGDTGLPHVTDCMVYKHGDGEDETDDEIGDDEDDEDGAEGEVDEDEDEDEALEDDNDSDDDEQDGANQIGTTAITPPLLKELRASAPQLVPGGVGFRPGEPCVTSLAVLAHGKTVRLVASPPPPWGTPVPIDVPPGLGTAAERADLLLADLKVLVYFADGSSVSVPWPRRAGAVTAKRTIAGGFSGAGVVALDEFVKCEWVRNTAGLAESKGGSAVLGPWALARKQQICLLLVAVFGGVLCSAAAREEVRRQAADVALAMFTARGAAWGFCGGVVLLTAVAVWSIMVPSGSGVFDQIEDPTVAALARRHDGWSLIVHGHHASDAASELEVSEAQAMTTFDGSTRSSSRTRLPGGTGAELPKDIDPLRVGASLSQDSFTNIAAASFRVRQVGYRRHHQKAASERSMYTIRYVDKHQSHTKLMHMATLLEHDALGGRTAHDARDADGLPRWLIINLQVSGLQPIGHAAPSLP